MFGTNNFFLEIQDHQLDEDRRVLPQVYKLSSELGIPMVATNDAHYLHKDDARMHEIMLCIQTGKQCRTATACASQPSSSTSSRSNEMKKLFGDVPDALTRTWDIAQRCNVKLEKVKDPFPKFDVPPEHTIDTYFEYVARQGFEKRRPRLEAMARAGAPQARSR